MNQEYFSALKSERLPLLQNGWDGGHWSLLRKFYGRNHNFIDCYGISVSQMTTDKFHLSQALLGPRKFKIITIVYQGTKITI
jgi:hypothetical protein